ncbi:MAG: hypothetical protein LPH21_14835, partial [Shewanella sp.]|nr:hypothetical protein [Shewanella sp.]
MKKQMALNYLMNQLWAIDPAYLTSMGAIAERRALSEASLTELLSLDKVEAVAAKTGRAAGQLMQLRENGVAVLAVGGVVSRYASWLHAICGGVSTELLAKEFNQALDDRAVRAIVLNIDSPGGDANGIHELAEMI